MKKRRLGSSDLEVSEVCLGSMTWGRQNTKKEGFEQIDYALDQGINFIDTAEMYPVPPKPEGSGDTERCIGAWLKQHPEKRDQLVIASKMVGPGLGWIRVGRPISGADLKVALEGSLQRLNVDCIDVYQLHWPNRTSPHFGKHWPGMVSHAEVDRAREDDEMLEILHTLQRCMDDGKIRHFGLSNDTPWGIGQYVRLSEKHGLPKAVSVQNEFSLLHAKDLPYMLESCVLENVAYLPWSPMGAGILSGKYRNGQVPEGSRWSLIQRKGLFRNTPKVHEAVEAYWQVAERHDISLAQLALLWVYRTEGVTSTIIGATSMQQLKEDIDAYYLQPSAELIEEVNQVLRAFPLPF